MNRHYADDIAWLTFPSLEAVPGLLHVVSTRIGGVSAPPFDALNLAFHVGDEPTHVLENRRRFAAALGFSLDDVVATRQVHETTVRVVTRAECGTGASSRAHETWACDALVTQEAGVFLMGFSADCPLVMLVDAQARVLGLAHAGWRPAFAGILAKTISAMTKLGAEPARMLAAVAPAIGPCCYEVGAELKDALPRDCGEYEAFFRPTGLKFMLDLPGLCQEMLINEGLQEETIDTSRTCSRCCERDLFSYRRDGRTGRYAAVIGWRHDYPSPR